MVTGPHPNRLFRVPRAERLIRCLRHRPRRRVGMVGQYAAGTSWAMFSAMSIVMSIPAVMIFFFLQRYLVSGLAAGGVKG